MLRSKKKAPDLSEALYCVVPPRRVELRTNGL